MIVLSWLWEDKVTSKGALPSEIQLVTLVSKLLKDLAAPEGGAPLLAPLFCLAKAVTKRSKEAPPLDHTCRSNREQT